jgi:hypothetical protein
MVETGGLYRLRGCKCRLIIAALLSLCICGGGCKKEDEYFYVDDQIISWFNFPDKSYWVFIDSASHYPDSLAWQGGSHYTAAISAHRYSESYNLYAHEYLNGATKDTAVWELLLAADGSYSRVYLSMFLEPAGPDAPSTSFSPLYSQPVINNFLNSHTNKYNEIRYEGSTVINNKRFDSVYHVRFFSPGNSAKDEHIYFNRNVGFLKFVQHSISFDRTLELDRWNVPR